VVRLIEVRNLTFSYPESLSLFSTRRMTVFNGLNISFGGGVNYLRMPNGWGKTTLLRILAGILVEQSGEITFQGRPVSQKERLRLAVYVPSIPTFPPRIRVSYLISIFEKRYGTRLDQRFVKALSPYMERQAIILSLGYRKFLAVALASLKPCDVFLIDEVSQVDSEKRDLFLEVLQERGVLVISESC